VCDTAPMMMNGSIFSSARKQGRMSEPPRGLRTATEADDLKELNAGVFERPDHLVMEVAGGQVQVVGKVMKPEALEGLAEFTSDNRVV